MELMRKVYKEMIEDSKLMERAGSAVMRKIKELTVLQKEEMTPEEYEDFREGLLEISAVAQEEAFITGVQYGVTLLTQNLINEDAKGF